MGNTFASTCELVNSRLTKTDFKNNNSKYSEIPSGCPMSKTHQNHQFEDEINPVNMVS